MQLFAKDSSNCIVSAKKAIKSNKYYCLECASIVKMRRGNRCRPHFFHLQLNRACKISRKSLTHLQIQIAIQEMLSPEEITIEKHFSSINRIADVCWERKKLIFEVQCSHITAQEVISRNHDYKTLGYTVVWILHDKRYNQKFLSQAEEALQNHLHYYTNIDCEKNGYVYDILNKKKFPIQMSALHDTKNCCSFQPLQKREKLNPYYFKGDVLDAFYNDSIEKKDLEWLFKQYLEENYYSTWDHLKKQILTYYESIVDYFIENACK